MSDSTSTTSGGCIGQTYGTLDIDATLFERCDNSAGAGAIEVDSAVIRISGAAFHDGDAAYGAAISATSSTSLDVSHTIFCDNDSTGGGGAAMVLGTGGTWTNNVFARNGSTGQGSAAWFSSGARPTLVNNTFHDNGTLPSGMDLRFDAGATEVVNNAFSGSAGLAVSSEGDLGSSTLHHNAWFGNNRDVQGGGTSESAVTANPLFVAPDVSCDKLDLSLSSGSPLIDAGDPTREDADGSDSDIGAYGGEGSEGPVE